MSTDRKLLEAAAKAAGVTLVWHEPDDAVAGETWCFIPSAKHPHNRRESDELKGEIWNPLTDDGDALRLAVKLNLLLMPYPLDNAVRVTRLDQPDTIVSWGAPPDPGAATRRAIVRAAAAIGGAA